jgi:hypothetical protein
MTRAALVLVGAVAVALAASTPAEASCIYQSPAQQRARADVIFVGVALEGPTRTGVQRFKVTRYLKSRGPAIVRVQTGHKIVNGTGSTTSVAIVVRKGERWRIFARGSVRRIVQTSVCDGSRRL